MSTHYERRTERLIHDLERDDNYDALSTSSATTYRSAMGPRETNFQRTRSTALRTTTSGVSTGYYRTHTGINSSSSGFGPGLASLVNLTGVPIYGGSQSNYSTAIAVNSNRQRDKTALELLNDKFAQYIEKVRFLEAHNRKLALELEILQSRAGQGSSRIREMYDIERSEANKLIDTIRRDAAAANVKSQQLQQDLSRQKVRYNEIASIRSIDQKEIDNIQRQIAENEAQIALFRRRIGDLDDEYRRYKSEIQRLSTELDCLQREIQNELSMKNACEVEKLAIEDAIASLKHRHEIELAEIHAQQYSSALDPSQFFRNELVEAIREIRQDYEAKVNSDRQRLHSRFSLDVNEIYIQNRIPDQNLTLHEHQREQLEHLRSDLVGSRNQNVHLRTKIQEMGNLFADLKARIQEVTDAETTAKVKSASDLDEARRRLAEAQRKYDEVTTFRTSLQKEIDVYREKLESQNGLRGVVDRIDITAQQQATKQSASGSYSYSHSSSVRNTPTSGVGSSYAFSSTGTVGGGLTSNLGGGLTSNIGGGSSSNLGGGSSSNLGVVSSSAGSRGSIIHTIINTANSNNGYANTGSNIGVSKVITQSTTLQPTQQSSSGSFRTVTRQESSQRNSIQEAAQRNSVQESSFRFASTRSGIAQGELSHAGEEHEYVTLDPQPRRVYVTSSQHSTSRENSLRDQIDDDNNKNSLDDDTSSNS